MNSPFEKKAKPIHPYAWLWECLESDPAFLLRPMFGGKAVYLDGKLMLYFTAKQEPWRGLLVCTDRSNHLSLIESFQSLWPHPILGKWLYLSEETNDFEKTAERVVTLVRHRDPRIGVIAGSKKQRSKRKISASRRKPGEAI